MKKLRWLVFILALISLLLTFIVNEDFPINISKIFITLVMLNAALHNWETYKTNNKKIHLFIAVFSLIFVLFSIFISVYNII